MRTRYVIWDMDSVMTPGRATTHLARGYDGDPHKFVEYFLSLAGMEGALSNVPREQLEHGLAYWQHANRQIAAIGDLAECLTDLRHKVPRSDSRGNVFPSSRETVFTKNYILRGLSIRRIKEITDEIPYNDGVLDVVFELRSANVSQVLFSNTNAIVADRQAERNFFSYARGAVPVIMLDDHEFPYIGEVHYRWSDAMLAGRMHEDLEKKAVVFEFLDSRGVSPEEVLAIDDSDVEFLELLQAAGGVALGSYNEADKDCTPKNKDKIAAAGIKIVTDARDIMKFLRV